MTKNIMLNCQKGKMKRFSLYLNLSTNLLSGLYNVEAGDAPDKSKPRVEEDVRLAIRFEAVADLARECLVRLG